MKIRFIDSPALPGDFNMACDYNLSKMCRAGSDAIFRLYTWEKPAVSLGFHQKSEDVDREKCAADGIDVVRRPTGGRAILHWGEITYCFIYPVLSESGKQMLKEVYAKVHRGLAAALQQSGAAVGFASPGRKSQPHNPLCFASAAGTELELDGKKVVGSAQRLMDIAILQHGSILLTDHHLQMPEYLLMEESKRKALKKLLAKQSAHLPLEDSPDLRKVISEAIADVFELEMIVSSLQNSETVMIEELRAGFSL